jgi:hypothetical protein
MPTSNTSSRCGIPPLGEDTAAHASARVDWHTLQGYGLTSSAPAPTLAAVRRRDPLIEPMSGCSPRALIPLPLVLIQGFRILRAGDDEVR